MYGCRKLNLTFYISILINSPPPLTNQLIRSLRLIIAKYIENSKVKKTKEKGHPEGALFRLFYIRVFCLSARLFNHPHSYNNPLYYQFFAYGIKQVDGKTTKGLVKPVTVTALSVSPTTVNEPYCKVSALPTISSADKTI